MDQMGKIIVGVGICFCFISLAGCKTENETSDKKINSSSSIRVSEVISTSYSKSEKSESSEKIESSTSFQESESEMNANAGLFSQLPEEFVFSSGAGGWRTVLTMDGKGGFTGIYTDYDASEVHRCDFKGSFKTVEQISDLEYKMNIENLEVTGPQSGREGDYELIPTNRIYGLDDADEIRIYLPGKTTNDLPKEFIDWMYHPMKLTYKNLEPELPFYGLYNVNGQQGFASEDIAGYREKIQAQMKEKQNNAPVNMVGNWTITYTDDSTIGSFEVKEDGSGILHSTTELMGQEGDLPFDEIEFKADTEANWENGYFIRFKKPMAHNDLVMEKRVVLIDQNTFRIVSYTDSGINSGKMER